LQPNASFMSDALSDQGERVISTVIIGGGDKLRLAITQMENASVNWTTAQRDNAHQMFLDMAASLTQFTAAPQPPA
jgi:hypothetical protein